MLKFRSNSLTSDEIAEYLQLEVVGNSVIVTRPMSLESVLQDSLCYVETLPELELLDTRLSKTSNVTAICQLEFKNKMTGQGTFIFSPNPRFDFYRVLTEFFTEEMPHFVSPSAYVGPQVKLGHNVSIGLNSVIDGQIHVGYNTFIGNNVSIKGIVSIGSNCVINDGAIIGGEGFEFIKDGSRCIHVPKLGRIQIGDRVWIGNSSTVERPTLDETIIESDVKIDDLVHVGESSTIGAASQLTAGTVLAKAVKLGKNCFLGVNCSVKQRIQIADDTTIGMGAVVIRDVVQPGYTFAGVPSRIFQRSAEPVSK